jgi:hypothetical protein
VHDSRSEFSANPFEIRTVVKERVDQSSGIMAWCGVDHNPGVLVDHNQMVILVKDIDFNRLRFKINRFGRGNKNENSVARFNPVSRLLNHSVNPYTSIENKMGSVRTGKIVNTGGKQCIKPCAGFVLMDEDGKSAAEWHDEDYSGPEQKRLIGNFDFATGKYLLGISK